MPRRSTATQSVAKRLVLGAGLSVSVLIAMAVFAMAQGNGAAHNTDIGKQEYRNYGAVCHCADGKGDGPLASILKKKVPDLTLLQKENHGVFPVQRVYDIIDDTRTVEGHGSPDMPAWGVAFVKQAPSFEGPVAKAGYVTARILALVGCLASIQAK